MDVTIAVPELIYKLYISCANWILAMLCYQEYVWVVVIVMPLLFLMSACLRLEQLMTELHPSSLQLRHATGNEKIIWRNIWCLRKFQKWPKITTTLLFGLEPV